MFKPSTFVFALTLTMTAPSMAQPKPTTGQLEYAFDDDQVDGTLLGPVGDIHTGRRRRTPPSLIELRTDFIPELAKTVDDL